MSKSKTLEIPGFIEHPKMDATWDTLHLHFENGQTQRIQVPRLFVTPGKCKVTLRIEIDAD